MRDLQITIAKAIGIILMVAGHSGCYDYMCSFIYMFHMPLFFFFAGYCFKEKYLEQPRAFIKKRLSSLYLPFVKWQMIFLLLHNVFYWLNIYNDDYGNIALYSNWHEWGKAAWEILKMNSYEQLLGGYWFLKSLLIASILGIFIVKYDKSKCYIGGGCILLALTIGMPLTGMHFPVIQEYDTFATVFFLVGYKYKSTFCQWHKSWKFALLCLAVVAIGPTYLQNGLLKFEEWQVIPYGITAVCGTLLTFYISGKINAQNRRWKQWLVQIGDNTFTILTWHFLSFKLVSLLIIGIYGLPLARLAEFPVIAEYAKQGWFVFYTAIGVFVPLLMARNKHLK